MASQHQRNTTAMHESRRCGARTRRGTMCNSPAVNDSKRCRMHGGAAGSGAPFNNKNALKHGMWSVNRILNDNKLFDPAGPLSADFASLLETLEDDTGD